MGASNISKRRRCELLGLNRSRLYYVRQPENQENLAIMELIDRQYMETPYYGVRKMTAILNQAGYGVNRKRVRRLMQLMGLQAIYQKPRTSQRDLAHKKYPYLLKGKVIDRPNQVWAADITYIAMAQGFAYLVAIVDWYSRYILSWRVSTTMDSRFCLEALEEALSKYGAPQIFNTDQGSQFTCQEWIDSLLSAHIQISMDGKGRFLDNIFVERVWRTVKYEDIYLKRYETVNELKSGLMAYLDFYNHRRIHQALDYKTPSNVFCGDEKPLKTLSGFQQLSAGPTGHSKVCDFRTACLQG